MTKLEKFATRTERYSSHFSIDHPHSKDIFKLRMSGYLPIPHIITEYFTILPYYPYYNQNLYIDAKTRFLLP